MAVKADDIPVMTYWIWTVKNSQEDLLLSYNTEISTQYTWMLISTTLLVNDQFTNFWVLHIYYIFNIPLIIDKFKRWFYLAILLLYLYIRYLLFGGIGQTPYTWTHAK